MNTASTFEDFRPGRPGGMGRGALLALLVHVGLLIALAFGVSWRSSEPTGATAELWAAVPETAAPAAVAPPEPKPAPPPPPKAEPEPARPQVRDAEIAIEKAKADKARRELAEREAQKKREQQAKAEREKAQKVEAAKADAAKAERAEAERLAKLREEQLKRIAGQAGGTGAPTATGSAARDAGPSASYAGRIIAKVKPNIVFTDSVTQALRAEVEVRAAPDGTILGRRLVKASGNKDWDDAVLRAIDRTETLPRDVDGRVPSPITIGFTP